MNIDLSEIELPVRLRFERPMTDEELMRFCAANEVLRVEREPNGEILVMTPAGFKNSKMNSGSAAFSTSGRRRMGVGLRLTRTADITLPDGSMRAPDGAWVELRRWQALSAEQQTGYAPVCPDFVIELRSPSDRLPDIAAKMEQWMANGAQVGWLIDPERRVVAIYRAGQAVEVLEDPSSVQGDGPVAGFELVMARVWE